MINTQQAQTNVLVPDRGTVVFGGVSVQNQTKLEAEVPFFGGIPLLGYLFKSKVVTDNYDEFIFLITLKIVPG